jgi:hypothetical protein
MLAGLRSHVRTNLVAYTALFFALSGTGAYASHLVVRSSDIVNGQVKSADIGARAVKPADRAGVPHALAVNTAGASIPIATSTVVPMNSIRFGSGMRLVGGELRVTRGGLYFVSATINWNANGTGGRAIDIVKNGLTSVASDIVPATPSTFGITRQDAEGITRLAPGDTLRLQGGHNSGAPLSIFVQGEGASLSAFWIGP